MNRRLLIRFSDLLEWLRNAIDRLNARVLDSLYPEHALYSFREPTDPTTWSDK